MPKMTRFRITFDGIDATRGLIVGDLGRFSIDRYLIHTISHVKVGINGSLWTLDFHQVSILIVSKIKIIRSPNLGNFSRFGIKQIFF